MRLLICAIVVLLICPSSNATEPDSIVASSKAMIVFTTIILPGSGLALSGRPLEAIVMMVVQTAVTYWLISSAWDHQGMETLRACVILGILKTADVGLGIKFMSNPSGEISMRIEIPL